MKDISYTVDLTRPTIKGSTTLPVGKYRGMLVAKDKRENSTAIVLSTAQGAHWEEVDSDLVGPIDVSTECTFEISMSLGVVAVLKGNKYRLIESRSRTAVTDWISPQELHKTIVENNYKTAVPSLVKIKNVE